MTDEKRIGILETNVKDIQKTMNRHQLVLFGPPGEETEDGGIVAVIRDLKRATRLGQFILIAVIVDVGIRGLNFLIELGRNLP